MERVITPEERIANVAKLILEARASKRYRGRAYQIRSGEAQLRELCERYARGELEAIPDDGLPF